MDTTVSTPQAVATVIAVEGQAFARDPAGQMRPLGAGDVLREGDTIVTLAGGQVQLAFLDGQMLTVLPGENFRFSAETAPGTQPETAESALAAGEADRIIQALERGEDIDAQLEDTAAGLDGGGDAGSSFVRLLRIVEGVDALTYQFEARGTTGPEFTDANSAGVAGAPLAPPPVPTVTHTARRPSPTSATPPARSTASPSPRASPQSSRSICRTPPPPRPASRWR